MKLLCHKILFHQRPVYYIPQHIKPDRLHLNSFKIYSLDYLSVSHVKARNNSLCKHLCSPPLFQQLLSDQEYLYKWIFRKLYRKVRVFYILLYLQLYELLRLQLYCTVLLSPLKALPTEWYLRLKAYPSLEISVTIKYFTPISIIFFARSI